MDSRKHCAKKAVYLFAAPCSSSPGLSWKLVSIQGQDIIPSSTMFLRVAMTPKCPSQKSQRPELPLTFPTGQSFLNLGLEQCGGRGMCIKYMC